MKDKVEKLLEKLNKGLVGKEKIIRLGLLAILSGENLLLVGPPGTAKSEISRRLTKILKDESYFEYLLTKFTTPEEIFGPLSIKKLQEDKFERNTESYMSTRRIVFLDEIFKANSSILNTLLTILNEKIFHNGIRQEKVPLLALIGASNELPLGNDELSALYDRFLLRSTVDYISDEDIDTLLEIDFTEVVISEELKITEKELEEIREGAEKVEIPEGIKNAIKEIRIAYNKLFKEDKHENISDRKLVKIIRLIKISAYINGRGEADYSDVLLLINCLWNNPENIEKVTKLVLDIVKKNITRGNIIENVGKYKEK